MTRSCFVRPEDCISNSLKLRKIGIKFFTTCNVIYVISCIERNLCHINDLERDHTIFEVAHELKVNADGVLHFWTTYPISSRLDTWVHMFEYVKIHQHFRIKTYIYYGVSRYTYSIILYSCTQSFSATVNIK